MRQTLLIIIFLFGFSALEAQEPTYRQYVKAADLFYKEYKDYFNAGEFYKKAYEFPAADKDSLSLRIAESAFHSWKLIEAEDYYKRFLTMTPDTCTKQYRKIYFRLGEVYQRLADYDKAVKHFEKSKSLYRSCQPASFHDTLGIDHLINTSTWASAQEDILSIEIQPMDSINDSTKHELAIVPREESIIYTSFSFPEKSRSDYHHQIGQIVSHSDTNSDTLFQEQLSFSNRSKAYATYNADATRVYYTLCDHRNTLDMNCRIVLKSESSISHSIVLEDSLNESTYTQPHITYDDLCQQEVLFFVSDREGGKGGTDIWYIYLDPDGMPVGLPVNLEGINSPSNEKSPFYDPSHRTLYFSSDRTDDDVSFGGMDIYQTLRKESQFSFGIPQIIERPFNSSKNDIFFVRKGDRSWLSSNRTDPRNEDATKDACCYDLFVVEGTPTVITEVPDSIYFTPLVYYSCPDKKDSLLTISTNDMYLISASGTISMTEDSIKIQKDKQYELLVMLCDREYTFPILQDTSQKKRLIQEFTISAPAYYEPMVFSECHTEEPVVFSNNDKIYMVLLGEKDSEGRRYPVSNDRIMPNSCDLLPVEREKHYWLVVEKEGFYPDTLDVKVGEDQCGPFSCEFYIQPREVELDVMIECPCENYICYMSSKDYSVKLTHGMKEMKNLTMSTVAHTFKVTPWQTYSIHATIKETGEQLEPQDLQIKFKRDECTFFHYFKYHKMP